MDFVFRKLEGRSDVSTPAGRARALEDALKLIYPLRASYMIDSYFVQIADRLGVDAEMVRASSTGVFREVARAEEQARSRERMRDQATRREPAAPSEPSRPAPAPSLMPSYADEWVEDAPYDYVPVDADAPASAPAAAPFSMSQLTELERRSLAGERELLCLLSSHPDAFRPHAERICSIDWVDPRGESIAWAILATPEGTPPAEALAAARAVCSEAAELVAAGTISEHLLAPDGDQHRVSPRHARAHDDPKAHEVRPGPSEKRPRAHRRRAPRARGLGDAGRSPRARARRCGRRRSRSVPVRILRPRRAHMGI